MESGAKHKDDHSQPSGAPRPPQYAPPPCVQAARPPLCSLPSCAGLHWQREKELQIDEALRSSLVDVEALRKHAVSMGGLFYSDIRRRVWPKLVGVNMYCIKPYEGAPLSEHKDRAQVLLDVNRCTRRIPEREYHIICIISSLHELFIHEQILSIGSDYSEIRKKEVQEKLLRIILRLLSEHPDLHYYQGFHDIVITFLLVGGEEFAYAIVNVLVQHHIRYVEGGDNVYQYVYFKLCVCLHFYR